MKNPHGVPPTRFMKRKESEYAIKCCLYDGPIFGNDIISNDERYGKNSCSINNDGNHKYDCHPVLKKSLFVNTAGPDETNVFSVLDYEVYYNYDSYKDYIFTICRHPDMMMEYIETKDISKESLKQIDDESGLLNDLDTIHCKDSDIRLKISRYYFKNPSKFLPDTQLVNQQYDTILREWLGKDYKWKLLYRTSEHEYTAKSFHDCCDDKGPTLVVIKSSGGWIFGGYTTQSWKHINDDSFDDSDNDDYYRLTPNKKDDNKAFIFTLKNPHGVEPTRFMKRAESKYVIQCYPNYGPIFGDDDMIIANNCSKEDSCWINNDGSNAFKCHSEYMSSLFVNINGLDNINPFSVLDYEVYTHY